MLNLFGTYSPLRGAVLVSAIYACLAALSLGQHSTEPVATPRLAKSYDLAASFLHASPLSGTWAEFTVASQKERLSTDPFRQLAVMGVDPRPIRDAVEHRDIDLFKVELAALDTADALSNIDASDQKCLSQAVYYEARNQGSAGKMAIADVVMNRVAHPFYPDSVCEVVYQGSERETGCQFTFTCDGSKDRAIEPVAMQKSRDVAIAVLAGLQIPLSNNALNYHADYVEPYWAPHLLMTARIGDHVFYRPENAYRYARRDIEAIAQ